MPPVSLAQMIQIAFRVVAERESVRLALLLGVVPGLAAYLGGQIGLELFGEQSARPLVVAILGALLGYLVMLPAAVKAAGDLLARRLDRPPVVTPALAVARAYRLFGAFALALCGLVAVGLIAFSALSENPAGGLILLAFMVGAMYVVLGFSLLPQVTFYEEDASVARGFQLARGERLRLFAFIVIVGLPFFFAANLLEELALAQPGGLWPVTLGVALVAQFINSLSTGPQIVGLTVLYFAKRGEAPPDLTDPAGPRT